MTTKTKRVPTNVPKQVSFEGMKTNPHTYDIVGFQAPKKGDYFLSGAVVQAHKAVQDMVTPYWVVTPK
jgi:hypothetical protein